MKLGQLIEYNKRNIFFENYAEKLGKETSSGPQTLFEVNSSGL